jgi:hypothetical protein
MPDRDRFERALRETGVLGDCENVLMRWVSSAPAQARPMRLLHLVHPPATSIGGSRTDRCRWERLRM